MNTSPASPPSPAPEHEIVHVPSVGQIGREQLREQCYGVRIDVFHREQGFPLDAEIDEYVSKTITSAIAVAVSLSLTRCCGQGFRAYFRSLRRLDEIAEHFLLRFLPSLEPIGTVRIWRASSGGVPFYKLSRLAVLKPYRNHHFGRELVVALHKWAATDCQSCGEQSAKVVCHSQLPVKAFYAK
jgi:hypothetical protein